MGGPVSTTSDKPKINITSSSSSSKYQTIGPFLTSLFIPEPMKPIPVKAQIRKKSTLHFTNSFENTYSFWNCKNKTSFEEVSFISQRPTSHTMIEEQQQINNLDSITILSDGTSKSSTAVPSQPPHSTYHN